MKKLLFTIMLLAGISAQAQNTITLTDFSDTSSSENNWALAVGNLIDDACVNIGGTGDSEIDAVATSLVYTYNATTRELSRDGQVLTTYPESQAATIAGFFNGEFNNLYTKNSSGYNLSKQL